MNLKLAAVFGSGMVLQRDMAVPIWGFAPAGAEVAAALSGHAARCRAAPDGRWRLELPPMPAGGPLELAVRCGGEEVRIGQVWLGEVWLAGGQSNMELTLRDSQDGEAAVLASAHPRLHFYMPAKAAVAAEAEAAEAGGTPPAWRVSTPETSGGVSAVAYYAARTLAEHLPDVHIGVLVCCWGGTYAHCWMPEKVLESFPAGRRRIEGYRARAGGKSDEAFAQELADYQRQVDGWNRRAAAYKAANPEAGWGELHASCGLYPWPPPAGRTGFQRPGGLYGSMLERLIPYALRGFWYYQGEQDEEWPEDYFDLLTHLISAWRQDWGDEGKPFLLLQLPMFLAGGEDGDPMRWPVLRKAQADAAAALPNVEMAVLADCGEFDNIHPADKRTPGQRLGLLALESVYRLPVIGRPPVCQDARRDGSGVVLRFTHTGGGLRLEGGGCGFRLAGEDGVFYPASAALDGADAVRVAAPEAPAPKTVRYAWYSFGPAGLYGGTGLAAAPLEQTVEE